MASLYIANIRILDLPANYERAYSAVSDERKEKADQYKNSEDKKRSLLSELLLRKALNDKGIHLKSFHYEYGRYNKPYLKDATDLFFNISHSGDYVILAVSDKEIGCDIEKIRKYELKIAERFFTKREYEDIIKIAKEDERQHRFFLYWVLKESFIKQSGHGLSQSLDSFEIRIDENKKISVIRKDNESDLHFKQLEIIPDYCIAVCSYDEDVEVISLDRDDLFKEGKEE